MKASTIMRMAGGLFFGLLVATALGACSLDKQKGPEIANLVYIPMQAPAEEGKTVALNGTFNVEQRTGEIVSVRTVVYDAQGKEVASATIPLDDPGLRTADTLGFGVEVSTAKKGDYTFQVAVTDGKGKLSNKLEGTFAVTDLF